jgi:hypothetical protein
MHRYPAALSLVQPPMNKSGLTVCIRRPGRRCLGYGMQRMLEQRSAFQRNPPRRIIAVSQAAQADARAVRVADARQMVVIVVAIRRRDPVQRRARAAVAVVIAERK